jgi:hypothetical protein
MATDGRQWVWRPPPAGPKSMLSRRLGFICHLPRLLASAKQRRSKLGEKQQFHAF